MPLSAEQTQTVRELIAGCLGIDDSAVVPTANFFTDLGGTGEMLKPVRMAIETSLGVAIEPIVAEVNHRTRQQPDGNLSAESLREIRDYLGDWPGAPQRPLPFPAMFTVGMIEAIAAKALESSVPTPPILALEAGQDPAWQLSAELGPRRSRLLLAGGIRVALTHNGLLDGDIADVLEVLEEFADTGKNVAAMKKAFREVDRWKTWRDPALSALRTALSVAPQRAVPPLETALAKVGRSLDALRDDLFPPCDSFAAEWRTPAAVALAQRMYDERHFAAMPQLADELERAGCRDTALSEHCRDPRAIHVRGCRVVDAVLAGSGARPKKAARKAAAAGLLALLPKREQREVKQLTRSDDWQTPIEQLAARSWTLEKYRSDRGSGASANPADIELMEHWKTLFPDHAPEQQLALLALHDVVESGLGGVLQSGLLRRIVQDDVGALARSVSLQCRTAFLQDLLFPNDESPWLLWGALAVNDVVLFEQATRRSRRRPAMQWDDQLCHYVATLAVLDRDDVRLAQSAARMSARLARPETQAMDGVFRGIAERQPALVAAGLQQLLDRERAAKEQLHFGAFCLEVHGLYGLAARVSPDLVSGFDVSQPPPWDRGLHELVVAGDFDPVRGLDLTAVSPLLHQWLVQLDLPPWLHASPTQARNIPLCDIVLTNAGPHPKKVLTVIRNTGVSGESKETLERQLANVPVTLRSRAARGNAERFREALEAAGATVELM